MGLDMGAFDDAWQLLKALPEQQAFTAYMQAPKTMGQAAPVDRLDNPDEHGFNIDRYTTVPPAIRGLLERGAGQGRFAGADLHVPRPGSLERNLPLRYIESAPDRRDVVEEQRAEDEAQKLRGSAFHVSGDTVPYEG